VLGVLNGISQTCSLLAEGKACSYNVLMLRTQWRGFLFGIPFLLMVPVGAAGETLREMLKREGIHFKITNPGDLEKQISSGESEENEQARTIATYVYDGHLSETLYVFRFDKLLKKWNAAELKWPQHSHGGISGPSVCQGGAIVNIEWSAHFIYLDGHINPSASCTMVLTKELKVSDTIYGWVVGIFANETVLYQHSEVHFAPTHYVELSVYHPTTRTRKKIYPMKPYQEVRRQYMIKVKAAYEKCCVESPPTSCGGYFKIRNHHCDAELFDNSLKEQLAINDATNSLAFVTVFDDAVVAERPEVAYIYRNLTNGRKIEYREVLLSDLKRKYGDRPLGRYLEDKTLRRLFARQP
jgi:hypothetical protein